MLFTTKPVARLSGTLALFTIVNSFSLLPSTIMLDLPLKRALIAVQPMPWEEHEHSFSWSPFGRFITVKHRERKAERDLFIGLLVDYRYRLVDTGLWFDVATALAGERVRSSRDERDRSSRDERRRRVGFDDITFQLGYDVVADPTCSVSPYLMAGVPTTRPSAAEGVLIGTGNAFFGGGFDAAYAFWQPEPDAVVSGLVSGLVVHSFKRAVTLNKRFKEIGDGEVASDRARFHNRFDIGNGFFGIFGVRYDAPCLGVELGYNPVVLFGTDEDVAPLTRHHQGLFKFKCEHQRTALLSQVTTPLIVDNVKKPFVIHGIYGQAQSRVSVGDYDVSVLAGLSHDFSQDHIIKRWTGWIALSVHF